MEGSVKRMVRIKIIARVIPEDVYMKYVESHTGLPATLRLTEEKRLVLMVNDPEKESIGVLANRIKGSFQNINHELVVSSEDHNFFY